MRRAITPRGTTGRRARAGAVCVCGDCPGVGTDAQGPAPVPAAGMLIIRSRAPTNINFLINIAFLIIQWIFDWLIRFGPKVPVASLVVVGK